MSAPRNNSSRMFLTELMFSILFFIIIVGVCVGLFAQAHKLSIRSKEMTQAVNLTCNVAEFFQVWDESEESWAKAFPTCIIKGSRFEVFYDDNWQECQEAEATFRLSGFFSGSDTLKSVRIIVSEIEDSREIYNLEVYRALKR